MTKHISRHAGLGFNPKRLSGLRGRRLDDDECRAVETQLRQDGKIQ
jgi:hypothetical protein